MSLAGWQTNTKLNFGGGDPWWIISTAAPTLPDTGLFITQFQDVMGWQTINHLRFQDYWYNTVDTSTATIMTQTRSMHRRVFSRVFGRIN